MDREAAIAKMAATAGAEIANADFILRGFSGPDHVASAQRSLIRARTFIDAATKLAINSDDVPIDRDAELEAGKILAEMAVSASSESAQPVGKVRRFVDVIIGLFASGKTDRQHAEKALRDAGLKDDSIHRLLAI